MEDKFEQIVILNRRMRTLRLCAIVIGTIMSIMSIVMLACAIVGNVYPVSEIGNTARLLLWLIRVPFVLLFFAGLYFYFMGFYLQDGDGPMDEESDCCQAAEKVIHSAGLIVALSLAGAVLADAVYNLFV